MQKSETVWRDQPSIDEKSITTRGKGYNRKEENQKAMVRESRGFSRIRRKEWPQKGTKRKTKIG
jgi:hypothetical protein